MKTSTSFLSFTATAGTTYLIQVGGFSGASGDGVINVTEGVGCSSALETRTRRASARSSGPAVALVADNAVNLELTDLPLNQTVLFVNSRETILVANPGGSQGDLCIGSFSLGRHVNDVLDSGATGAASLTSTSRTSRRTSAAPRCSRARPGTGRRGTATSMGAVRRPRTCRAPSA